MRWVVFAAALLLALPAAADMYQDASNAKLPEAAEKLHQTINVMNYGAIADGQSHPLSQRYATLAEAQAFCPRATSLTTDELDWCAADAALARAPPLVGGSQFAGGIRLMFPGGIPHGYYRMSKPLVVNNTSIWFDGDGQYQTKLVWNTGVNGIEYGLTPTPPTGQGGSLRVSNMTLSPGPTGPFTATGITAKFRVVSPTLTIENVNFGGMNTINGGDWRIAGDFIGLSSSTVRDVKVSGPGGVIDPLGVAFRVTPNLNILGSFHHYWTRVFAVNYMVGFQYNMPADAEDSVQGVYMHNVDVTNGGDFIKINNSSGRSLPQWMITNSHWQGFGWFVNTAGSTNTVNMLVAQGNFIQAGGNSIADWPSGVPLPTIGGGFNLTRDEQTIITSNHIQFAGGIPTVRGVWAGGDPTQFSRSGVFANNTCEIGNTDAAVGGNSLTCAYLDTKATGWSLGRNSVSPVNDNVRRVVNLGTANTTQPVLVAQNAVAKNNTGNGTTHFNLASILLPPLGPDDTVRVNTMWTTGGTATNIKRTYVGLAPAACPVNTLCTGGGQFAQQLTLNTAAMLSTNTTVYIRNTGATNAQVWFDNTNQIGLGASTSAPATAAIETKDGAYINLSCATATSVADSCTLLGYSVEILPGM